MGPGDALIGRTSYDEAVCRVCGATNGVVFAANGFSWFGCGGCNGIQKILTYPQYLDLHPSYDPGAYLDSANRDQIERFLRLEDASKVLERATKRHFTRVNGAKRSFLDVGCGMGGYLLAAQRLGFEVLGFEPSADHAHVATKLLKLPVIADYFTPERVGDKTFDLIMLSHVIEHIYEPKLFLRQLVDILKPGGVLIVITPNSDSLVARATGKRWPMLKPIDHVTMLCAKSYTHFQLEDLANVYHGYSEFPYEFAATFAAVLKAGFRRQGRVSADATAPAVASNGSTPPPLRELGLKTQFLKGMLTVASAPAWLIAAATDKQACLNTMIVRKSA